MCLRLRLPGSADGPNKVDAKTLSLLQSVEQCGDDAFGTIWAITKSYGPALACIYTYQVIQDISMTELEIINLLEAKIDYRVYKSAENKQNTKTTPF